jgi:hypothetical protein
VPAGAGHRQPRTQRTHGGGEDPVDTVAFQGEHGAGLQLAAGVPGAAQPAEPFLADGEDGGQWQLGRPARRTQVALGDGDRGRDGDRVIPDPRAAQPAVALRDPTSRRLAEDIIDVHQQG